MQKITCDFETQSRADLKKVGAYEYSMDKSTTVSCFGIKPKWAAKVKLFDYYEMKRPFKEFHPELQKQWLSFIYDKEIVFCAHNAFFEQCIYNNVLVARYGWPPIPIQKWRCTAAKAASVAIPRNLGNAGAVMQLKIQKDYEGHRVMLKLCKPRAEFKAWVTANEKVKAGRHVAPKTLTIAQRPKPDEFWTPATAPEDYKKQDHYCKIDVISEEQLDDSLPDLSPSEQVLWFVDQEINLNGIKVDMPLVNYISKTMEAEAKVMNKELDVLTMGLVSSGKKRDAILDFLTLEGIEMPDLKAKTVDDFIENGKATGDALTLLKLRKALAKSSTAKYDTFKRRAKTDGRVRDLLLYHGASTGRWGGVGIQPQNFPRGVIKDIYEAINRINTCSVPDLKMLYGENLMPLFSSVLRGMFIASPNHDLLVEDYSAIECRVLFWLAKNERGLKLFREEKDPYKEMAVHIFNKSILDIDDDQRQVGKAAVLGCGYQMGGKKFVSSAWDVYRAKVTLPLARIAVSKFREIHYPVTELWREYEDACISAVENKGVKYRVGLIKFFYEKTFLWIQLPSGRKIAYKDPQVVEEPVYKYLYKKEENYTSSKEILNDALADGGEYLSQFQAKKLKYMAVNMKAKKVDCVIPKWTRETTYGGKITENIVQAVARDILAEAIVRCKNSGVKVLMHSHDELVGEAWKGKFKLERDSKGNLYAPEFRKLMEQVPTWAEGLPLKASGWADVRYRKG